MSLVPKYIKNLSSYKPGKRIEDVYNQYKLKQIIKLASNENPLGPSRMAIENVKKCLDITNRYPDSSGYLLRAKLAEKFKLNIQNVIIGNGSEGIMSSIIRTFLHESDELIGFEDSFIGFRVLAKASGRKINWIKMKDSRYNLNSIVKKINNLTKIIYLANPDNPMGTYFTKNEFEEFMSYVPERVLVILDEAYFEYASSTPDYPDSMSYRFDNVITLRTFSKCYGLAGFRVGYGFAHHTLIENLLKVKLPFEPSIPAQEAALGALDDVAHLEDTLRANTMGIKYFYEEFEKLKLKYIYSIANFVTIELPDAKEADYLLESLLKRGVIVRGLGSFGLPNCIRISVGTMEENNFFIEKIKTIINN